MITVAVLGALNAFWAIGMYRVGSYKSAMFSSFVAGVCLMAILAQLREHGYLA